MIRWGGFFFHNPGSYLIEVIISLHDYVMIFVVSVLILVLFLVVSLFFQCGFDTNFYENHQLEFVWTVVPFIILFLIIIPSLFSLYFLDSCSFCGYPLSIIGHQWYWSYNYPNLGYNFDSYIIPSSSSVINLLETDNSFVVPLGVPVRCVLSSVDVIHSWTIPSLGLKIDAIPGRLNNFCFSLKRPGIFFGQCSEICGVNHRFIPINLECHSASKFSF